MSEINPAPIRQWRLLRLLAGSVEGLTLRELAAQVEVSQKTIHRDLRLFQRTGFPVQEIVGSHGVKRWRLEPAGGEIPLGFTFDEALAIYLGWKSLHGLGGSNTWTCQGRDFPTVPGRAFVSPCRDVACLDNGVPCRVRKQLPPIQEKRARLNFAEWLHAEYPKMLRRRMRDLPCGSRPPNSPHNLPWCCRTSPVVDWDAVAQQVRADGLAHPTGEG